MGLGLGITWSVPAIIRPQSVNLSASAAALSDSTSVTRHFSSNCPTIPKEKDKVWRLPSFLRRVDIQMWLL